MSLARGVARVVASVAAVIVLSSCQMADPEGARPSSSGDLVVSSPEVDSDSPAVAIEANRWIPNGFASAFEQEAQSLGAKAAIGLSDMAGGPPFMAGDMGQPYAYSTVKILLAAALLHDDPGALNSAADDVSASLTFSDNGAARRIYDRLVQMHQGEQGAATAMGHLLWASGDNSTTVPTAGDIPNWSERQTAGVVSTYGQTLWPVGAQAQFTSALLRGCLVGPGQTALIASALSNVDEGQQWGFGQVPSINLFKGGWGQDQIGTGYVVRQVGEVSPSQGGPYILAIGVQLNEPSSIASGSVAREGEVLAALANWAIRNLDAAPPELSCE